MGSLTAPKAAIQLSHILNTFSDTHGGSRFPVDVEYLALNCGELFNWPDPITKVEATDIKNFEGCLVPSDEKDRWLLLYNNNLTHGQIRFTQAHELGHYILHRTLRDSFRCTSADMLNWSDDEKDIEAQADQFSSYLLMPLDDYRKQITGVVNLDCLSHCADRYGVSLTAAILKWLSYTNEKAVIVISIDGYMSWAWSSRPAMKAGAFFRTRNNVIPIHQQSLAANVKIKHSREGEILPARTWFKHAHPSSFLREMKIGAEQYSSIITLLILAKDTDAWEPK